MGIELRSVSKSFAGVRALDRVDLSVGDGELLALLGPSGGGKSTLLRLIAGLEEPDDGSVRFGGACGDGAPGSVGVVFQHYALFRHLSVRRNIAFGLESLGLPLGEIRRRVEEMLELVQLQDRADRLPGELSGGQRQRVAVARALAPRPKVLLLDEPFGALDHRVRVQLRDWLRRLNSASGMTTVLVTHDQQEALETAGRVVILNRGRVEQEGAPRTVFDRPASPFVAEFVGETNCVETTAEADSLAVWGPLRFNAPGVAGGRRVRIYFRPHDVYVTREKESLQVPARIADEVFKGAFTELALDLGGGLRVLAHLPRGLCEASGFAPGQSVYLGITGFHVFELP